MFEYFGMRDPPGDIVIEDADWSELYEADKDVLPEGVGDLTEVR